MGCDIHCFIEFNEYDEEDGKDGDWRPFGGEIHLGREYDVFGHIAGVRTSYVPVVPPRGFPSDAAYESVAANTLNVVDSAEEAMDYGERCVLRENCEGWAPVGGDENKVWDPDNHTHTWLTLGEWVEALSRERSHDYPLDPRYAAVTAAMTALEMSDKIKTRIVIWFDN